MASYEAALTSARTEATSTSETTAANEVRVMALERALADAEEECARAQAVVDRDEERSREHDSFVVQARLREGEASEAVCAWHNRWRDANNQAEQSVAAREAAKLRLNRR